MGATETRLDNISGCYLYFKLIFIREERKRRKKVFFYAIRVLRGQNK
jgi:hypothetical protein